MLTTADHHHKFFKRLTLIHTGKLVFEILILNIYENSHFKGNAQYFQNTTFGLWFSCRLLEILKKKLNIFFKLNICRKQWSVPVTLHKNLSFPLRIFFINVTKSAGIFTEEILNGNLHFLCNVVSKKTIACFL